MNKISVGIISKKPPLNGMHNPEDFDKPEDFL